MADLAPLGYGRVKARFVAGVADSADAGDAPDVVPLTGSVTFNLSAVSLRVVSAVPDPATIHPRPITVALDSDGYIVQNGSRLVSLLATDDPATNPTGLQWTVSFNLRTLEGDSVPAPPWNFELPRDAVVDLTEVAPLAVPAPNTIITKGDRGEKGDQGEPGPNTVPASEAIAAEMLTRGVLSVDAAADEAGVGLEFVTESDRATVLTLSDTHDDVTGTVPFALLAQIAIGVVTAHYPIDGAALAALVPAGRYVLHEQSDGFHLILGEKTNA